MRGFNRERIDRDKRWNSKWERGWFVEKIAAREDILTYTRVGKWWARLVGYDVIVLMRPVGRHT